MKYSYDDVPTIKEFAQDDSFIRGLVGPFGSGKSSGCVAEILRRAGEQKPSPDGIRRTRWAIIRNTFCQLEDTTIKTFQDWFPFFEYGSFVKRPPTFICDKIDGLYIEILFRALDRPDHIRNLLSLELTGAWVNEAREVPKIIIDGLQGRVGRYPKKSQGGATWFGIILDTNPPDDDSWWYELFEENCPDNAKLFKQPSGRSPEAENLKNLPFGYYENLAKGKDPEFIKVYIDGMYGYVQDGKPVYPMYNDTIHCKPLTPDLNQPIYRGWDFGLTPAVVFLQHYNGMIRIIDEIIADNMGADAFSDQVTMFTNKNYPEYEFIDIGDPAGMARSQTDEKTCFQILQAKEIDITGGDQDPYIRIESVKKPLNIMIDGKPGFLIDPKCRKLRKGFLGKYQYRRLQTSRELYVYKPDKNEFSHVHDALQYVCTRLYAPALKHKNTNKIDYHDLYADL